VQIAAQQAGKPYRYGSAGPSSFDCSGLINYAFAKAGKRLPRTSAALAQTARPVSKAAAKPGDLIFMRSGGRVSHAGIYAGNGMMVDAPSSGGRVSTRRIWTSNYTVGRVV
jgi:cell wall-associated NlpC family hydrolase